MDIFNRLTRDLPSEYSSLLAEKNPKLNSVVLNQELMKLTVDMELEGSQESGLDNHIERYIQDILKEFTVNVNINYRPKIEYSIETIKEEIIRYFPSGCIWIEDLIIRETENHIGITAPSEQVFYSMTKNGLKDILSSKLGQNIHIICRSELANCNEDIKADILQNMIDEENKLCEVVQANEIKFKRDEKKVVKKEKKVPGKEGFSFGKKKVNSITPLNELYLAKNITVEVDIFKVEERKIYSKENKDKLKWHLYTLSLTDKTTSIMAKIFVKVDKNEEFSKGIKNLKHAIITGEYLWDDFSKSNVLMIKYMQEAKSSSREDNASLKRVELHLHTQMSSMDGICSIDKYVEQAASWGHKALAITDHGVVQGFPDAMNSAKKHGIKMIYGMEGYLVNDREDIIIDFDSSKTYEDFVVFDIETTGLSYYRDKITEIGAVKIRGGKIVDRFSSLVNPHVPIPELITELTGISDTMVENAPTIDTVIVEFEEFCRDSVLVAHNSEFDISFIKKNMQDNGLTFNYPSIDTLKLARATVTDVKNYKLGTLAKNFGIKLTNAHRAVNDAEATAEIFSIMMNNINGDEELSFDEINKKFIIKNPEKLRGNHVVILAKNLVGLKNLYKIVSTSHLKYFYRKPRIPKSLLTKYREGLLIGSACSSGELFDAIKMNKEEEEIEDIADFYDYLEIQPTSNNKYLIDDGFALDDLDLMQYNARIYELGKKLNKPVVATCDAHYVNPDEDILRKILMVGQKMKVSQEPDEFYFRSTDEMLREFSYLGREASFEVVVENTNAIADSIEEILPVPDGTFPPVIEGSEEELTKMTYDKAHEIYGEDLPKIVEDRIKTELNSIIKNGYAVLYIIAQKLVKKSVEDGYYVGSRGSVGSSLVATLSGITEVNPLPAHYYCKKCSYNEFPKDFIGSGVDMESKNCPHCSEELIKEGHNIPFEVFLGFDGDKEPDIDLNFAGEYQSKAHKYTEDLFGKGQVFRAGTIGKLADKTAYGYVKNYFEDQNIKVSPVEIDRLVSGLVGVKRTTGQHPGGIMICPRDKEIYDFTPIQHPADDKTSGVTTTHFDYNSISGRILKLDILGHDAPTMIRMLEDFTDFKSENISFDNLDVLELFNTSSPLDIDSKIFKCSTGTYGIPEFGTDFVRQMLIETKPETFSDLVRISGLSHGTDVWINNAQTLVKEGKAKLSDVISTREDIMVYLIAAGADNKMAFDTMEKVRKGKGLTEENIEKMSTLSLPPWYVEACQKIKYMFPKAHAVAYVMMSFRIAYYKLYYPQAFYATYFSMKLDDFNGQLILKGQSAIGDYLEDLKNLNRETTATENRERTVLEVALEMYARGYEFLPVDLYKSDSHKFTIEEGKVRMPLRAISGLGDSVALNIVRERRKSEFLSVEDFTKRAKVTKTVVQILESQGCLKDLDEKNQISFF